MRVKRNSPQHDSPLSSPFSYLRTFHESPRRDYGLVTVNAACHAWTRAWNPIPSALAFLRAQPARTITCMAPTWTPSLVGQQRTPSPTPLLCGWLLPPPYTRQACIQESCGCGRHCIFHFLLFPSRFTSEFHCNPVNSSPLPPISQVLNPVFRGQHDSPDMLAAVEWLVNAPVIDCFIHCSC